MKIGVITINRVYNYGAELQTYAFMRKLQLMGYESEIIDYKYYKNRNHKPCKQSKPTNGLSFRDKAINFILYRIINTFL